MNRPAAINMKWRVGLPVTLLVAFLALGFAFRSLTFFQLAACCTTLYGLTVFTVGVFAYRSPNRAGARPIEASPDDELPMVSVLIPAHNEEMVIGHTLDHVLKLDYPRFEVIVIDDHSSDATGEILKRYPVEVVTRRNLPNRGKSEALNAALEIAQGDVICVFDADTEMAPNFLRLAVQPMLDNPEICGVQAQVRMYNRKHNFLTAGQDDEFALFCEITQMGRYTLGGASALGGNGQLTRRSAIHAVGGWSPASLTEDLDLTVRLLLAGRGRIAHVSEAVVWQEGVTSLRALIRQRTRWAEGMLRCFGEFIGQVVTSKEMPGWLRFDAFYALSSSFIPLFTFMGLVYTVSFMIPGVIQETLPHAVAGALGVVSLGALLAWSAVISFKRDRRFDVLPALRSMIYLLHWIPALFLALRNIFQDMPVVWEKTEHRGKGLISSTMPAGVAAVSGSDR